MNWKILLLSLFITPLLATEAFLNMSININGTKTEVSNIILSYNKVAKIKSENFTLLISFSPEMSLINYSCDLVLEVTILEKEKVITEPTFHLKWNEKSVIEFDSKNIDFVFSVVASQKPLDYGFSH